MPPKQLTFSEGDRVWVKVNVKPVPNPKLTPDGEAGIILERLSASTYKVLRPDRRRRKTMTLNITQLRPRNSRHQADPQEEQEDHTDDEESRNKDEDTEEGEYNGCTSENTR